MNFLNRSFVFLIVLLLLRFTLFSFPVWAQDSTNSKKIYLIGDVGEETAEGLQVIKKLREKVARDPGNSIVIFLGDNLYPRGMPEKESKDRIEAEEILSSKVKPFLDLSSRTYLIPGNHDWKAGHKAGYQQILRQEKFLDSLAPGGQLLLPGAGCPGPKLIHLKSDLVLILIDTQWLLHQNEKPGEESDCPIKTGLDLYAALEGLLKEHKDKKILIAGHHPLYSNGIHGGHSNFRIHVFPFTEINPNWYFPLPIIGSLYPLYQKYLGSPQDLAHPLYKVIRKSLAELFSRFPNTIYAAGHDHSLQYIYKDNAHYILSGSGSKTSFVKKKGKAEFSLSETGYSEVSFAENGEVILIQYSVDGNGNEEVAFKKSLFTKTPPSPSSKKRKGPLSHKIYRSASDKFRAGAFKKWLMGANYREVWESPLNFKVFDILNEKGGLEIVQRGGGMQTKSLRLEAKDGKQYVLRSINKDLSKVIPSILRGSFAADLVQDQVSAAHPYGAFVIPPMAESLGIYHTNPQQVFIPEDPEFGKYQEDFANTLALYEERPSGNWKGTGKFGDSKKIVNTTTVLKKIQGDNDNFIDQKFVLKNRLFDLLIGDWDRHDDQWRWASFKKGKGKIFKPIARDRDQAFFLNEGILPKLASRKWALPKFQGFDSKIKNVPGFMFNARWFDRSFLNGLEVKDWIKISREIEESLIDEVIDTAMRKWQKPIFELTGPEVSEKIKSRRDGLEGYALDYYRFLAREVDVVGSDKMELFKVERKENGNTDVDVFKISKKGKIEQKIYSREFIQGETREIRLFGLDGDDRFEIKGKAKNGIKLRVIGGEGQDLFRDESRIRGPSKNTIIYDTRKGNEIDFGREARNRTSRIPGVNFYNRKAFKYNVTLPLAVAAYNIDDGIFAGGGVLITTHGFRKEPFKNKHLVFGLGAVKTGAFDFKYDGTFNNFYRSLDFLLGVNLEGPNYTRNFFGVGNESEYDRERPISYYYVRYENFIGSALLQRRFGESFSLNVGILYENIEVSKTEGRFITDSAGTSGNNSIFDRKQFAGLKLGLNIDTRNSRFFPTRGIYFFLNGKSMQPVDDQSFQYNKIEGAFSFYLSFRAPKTITLSNRTGGGWTDGDIEFYQAQTLGGTGKEANIRGYRRTRFYGQTSFYNNTDMRITLFGFKTYLFPANVGLVGFYDIGRVWVQEEDSDIWHTGYGAGLWMTPFESITLEFDVAYGEFWIASFRFGFLF
jgi:Omp85 superfamily domain/Calcineurin-like phosphoesterase